MKRAMISKKNYIESDVIEDGVILLNTYRAETKVDLRMKQKLGY